MKHKKNSLGKTYKDYPHVSISFYSRYMAAEVMFGDPDEEEENIAVAILRSIKKVNRSCNQFSWALTAERESAKTSFSQVALACSQDSKPDSCRN